ncbi:MAG: histidine ammonia-lyase [Alphaproteobacteria bacterium]|nr:histidine ammonia-lyase [Alphaproteobacteria bacterium]
MTVILNDLSDFTLDNLRRVAWGAESVSLGPAAIGRIERSRADFLTMIEKDPDQRVYGVTTGFGNRAKILLSAEERQEQAKAPPFLVATGVGPALPDRVVRAMIFTRLVNFVSGYAGVSLETTLAVAAMLDGRPLPVVKLHGQDSEGELHQLFNLFHSLMGDMSQLRDQNGLRNGTACAPGMLGDMALRARRRWRLAIRVLALSLDAANMSLDPQDARLKPILNDACESEAIDRLNEDLAGVTVAGRRDYQSPISWRVVTRMAGQTLRVVRNVEAGATDMLTAVSDNPVFLGPDEAPPWGRCISTGGFHVPRAYQGMNWLTAAWADLAAIIARQVVMIHRGSVTGLPDRLWRGSREHPGFYLGTMAHEIANRAREAAMPALTPLYMGQDDQTDTVMPLFQAFEKEGQAAHALDLCLAMLAASASQALDVAGRPPAPALRPFLAEVRDNSPLLEGYGADLGAGTDRLAAAFSRWCFGEGTPGV